MQDVEAISAAARLDHAVQMGRVQLAAAARILQLANTQGQAAVELIEAATAGVAEAQAEAAESLGRMLDVFG